MGDTDDTYDRLWADEFLILDLDVVQDSILVVLTTINAKTTVFLRLVYIVPTSTYYGVHNNDDDNMAASKEDRNAKNGTLIVKLVPQPTREHNIYHLSQPNLTSPPIPSGPRNHSLRNV